MKRNTPRQYTLVTSMIYFETVMTLTTASEGGKTIWSKRSYREWKRLCCSSGGAAVVLGGRRRSTVVQLIVFNYELVAVY